MSKIKIIYTHTFRLLTLSSYLFITLEWRQYIWIVDLVFVNTFICSWEIFIWLWEIRQAHKLLPSLLELVRKLFFSHRFLSINDEGLHHFLMFSYKLICSWYLCHKMLNKSLNFENLFQMVKLFEIFTNTLIKKSIREKMSGCYRPMKSFISVCR